MQAPTLFFWLSFLLLQAFTCRDGADFAGNGEIRVGFYNLDNLFDTLNDPNTMDDDFTPAGKYRWTGARYRSKLSRMDKVIRVLADGKTPDVLGVCEAENEAVLKDLAAACDSRFSVLHSDSEDERGIDVAILYNRDKLELLDSATYPLRFPLRPADRSRSMLWAQFRSRNGMDTLQFIVCHFPSRRGGKKKSEANRTAAAAACRGIIQAHCNTARQNLVLMGDFNDEPWDSSMNKVLGAEASLKNKGSGLQNLMFSFRDRGLGTYRFQNQWNLLDHFIISAALADGRGAEYRKASAGIYSPGWLMLKKKNGYMPFRTFQGDQWLNGYSDHFPIYLSIQLSRNAKEKY